jgi:hypothetical protein
MRTMTTTTTTTTIAWMVRSTMRNWVHQILLAAASRRRRQHAPHNIPPTWPREESRSGLRSFGKTTPILRRHAVPFNAPICAKLDPKLPTTTIVTIPFPLSISTTHTIHIPSCCPRECITISIIAANTRSHPWMVLQQQRPQEPPVEHTRRLHHHPTIP